MPVANRYIELHSLYKGTNKSHILREAEDAMLAGDNVRATRILSQLPDRKALIANLQVHIEGKPVEKTFFKYLSGECKNKWELLKGLFSLCSHISVELEKNNMEYFPILQDTLDKVYKVMKE